MSLTVETDEQHNQLDCRIIQHDKPKDSGVESAVCSLTCEEKTVSSSGCGSMTQTAPTEFDAVPCTYHLREDNLSSRSRELLQPSFPTEAQTFPSSSMQTKVPVEQAEVQGRVSPASGQSRGIERSQSEPVANQRCPPECVKEEPEFFDVAMVYCQEDEELARKFGRILQKFIVLDGERKPRVYMDFLDLTDSLGGNEIEHFNHVLECSSFAFVIFSSKSVNSKDLKGKWDRTIALHSSFIDENCAKVVPIVTEPNLRLGYSFGSLTKVNLRSLLLGGRILDLVAVDDLKLEHFDDRFLCRISSHLNKARSNRQCKVTKCELSNFEQSTNVKQSTTQTADHAELIQTHYDTLVELMETEFGLLTYLFSREVLSHSEMDSITAEKTRHGKNEKLLSLLYLKRDAKSFEEFVCGLSESNQGHLVKRLRDQTHK